MDGWKEKETAGAGDERVRTRAVSRLFFFVIFGFNLPDKP